MEGKFGREPWSSSFFFASEISVGFLLSYFKEGKKRRGIFFMINLNEQDNYIWIVLKKIIFNFLRVIITRGMKHVQNGVNSKHNFVLERYGFIFWRYLIRLFIIMKLTLIVIDVIQKLKLVCKKLQKNQNPICIRY